MDDVLWCGTGVFDVVENLHAHGWSFGEGELRFNRYIHPSHLNHSNITSTLDLFYCAQIAGAIYRSSDQIEGIFPSIDEFDPFYTEHHALLHFSAWRAYYSFSFLTQPTTARFYRLPNLQDLPDSDSPLDLPGTRSHLGGSPHATKLPRWAYTVARTCSRQYLLPLGTITEIALLTLEAATTRLREAHPTVKPYSETQACFWLEYMVSRYCGRRSRDEVPSRAAWNVSRFGVIAAQGMFDVYKWKGKYSVQAWEGSWKDSGLVERDVEDGMWKSEVMWCGWPDGGTGAFAWWRGWEEELGGEEEMEILAAVAVEETVGVEMEKLDLAVRSHILLGVMRAAVYTGLEREDYLQGLERGMVQSGWIGEERAGLWLKEALRIMERGVARRREGRDATADLGGEWTALCKMEAFAAFEGV
ncbi:hypothetical protein BDV18DRAFT_164626 [Aspergillus unguis]